MRATGLVIATLLGLFAGAPGATAQDYCGTDEWNHNGSAMDVHICSGEVSIFYKRPRAALLASGVGPGTLLFRGRFLPQEITGDTTVDEVSRLAGTAYVFRAGCPPAPYPVRGTMHARIELSGEAPVRGGGCRVERHRRDVLVFD